MRLTLLLLLITGLLAVRGAPVHSQAHIVVKIATSAAAGSPEAQQLVKLASLIEARGEGLVHAKLFPAGRLGDGPTLLAKVKAGEVQVASVAFEEGAAHLPQLAVLSAPYLFHNQVHADRMLDGGLLRTLRAQLQHHSLRLLGLGPNVFRRWFVRGAVPTKPADLVALHAQPRSTLAEQIEWTTLGLAPSATAGEESAFHRATAVEARLAGWDEHAQTVVDAEDVLTGSLVVMSSRFHAGLPETLMAKTAELDLPDAAAARAQLRAIEDQLLKRMEGRGLTQTSLAKPQRKAFHAQAVKVQDAIAAAAGDGGKALLSVLRGR